MPGATASHLHNHPWVHHSPPRDLVCWDHRFPQGSLKASRKFSRGGKLVFCFFLAESLTRCLGCPDQGRASVLETGSKRMGGSRFLCREPKLCGQCLAFGYLEMVFAQFQLSWIFSVLKNLTELGSRKGFLCKWVQWQQGVTAWHCMSSWLYGKAAFMQWGSLAAWAEK